MQKEYTQTKEQVLEGLRTDRQGLSAQEAEKRLREHGENRLKEAEKLTLFQRFVQQLKDPMLLILMAAAAVSAVTNYLSHEPFTEVLIILAVVLLNAVLGVIQESKAEAAIEAAKAKIEANALKIAEIERTRCENKEKIAAAEETIRTANAARMEKEAAVARLGQENRALTDERERMSGEMARLAERKTAAETELNTTASKLWEEYQLTESEARSQCVPFESLTELRRSVAEVRGKIRGLGNVNVGAIEEFDRVNTRYTYLTGQRDDVEKAKGELVGVIDSITSEMTVIFKEQFALIRESFQETFLELFGGGKATLELEDENDVLSCGIEIKVQPPGKALKTITLLSGGEKAFVAIALYFAILKVHPTPFCVMDEIEAALDEPNVVRVANYMRRITSKTQFIVITHRRGTMEAADVLYGVTMQERGVSKVLTINMNDMAKELNIKE